MLVIGTIGLVINGIVGFILTKANSNLNVKSALLHVLVDLFTSFSVIIAALGIKYFGLTWLDPIGSIVTSVIIISGGVKITKESFNILMEGTPNGFSVDTIATELKDIENNLTINDIKIWCINEVEIYTLIDVHSTQENNNKLSNTIREKISNNFNIPSKNIYVNVN